MKKINIGDIIQDYKAKIKYVVTSAQEIQSGNTAIIAEVHVSQNAPTTGYDVIILDSSGAVPVSEAWGDKAWSFSTLKQAEKAYGEICSKRAILGETDKTGSN